MSVPGPGLLGPVVMKMKGSVRSPQLSSQLAARRTRCGPGLGAAERTDWLAPMSLSRGLAGSGAS